MKNLKIPIYIAIFLATSSCVDHSRSTSGSLTTKEERSDTIKGKDNSILKVENYKLNQLSSIFFFENNKVRKLIKYLRINGEIKPNQMYLFGKSGDTIHGESIYYDLYCVKDTIEINESYNFKVTLGGHLLDSAILYLCDYNSDFIEKSDSNTCSVFRMIDFNGPALSVKKKIKGWNYVRGRIENYSTFPSVKNSKGEDSTSFVQVYFIDSFYVK